MNLPIDNNGRAVQYSALGCGYNYEAGVLPFPLSGLIRVKNTGTDNAVIRHKDDGSDGVVLSPNETEYFVVNGTIEIVSGSVNIMF